MSTQGRYIGKGFEYLNFHISFILFGIQPDQRDNPETQYKYYSYNYGTYNVFTMMIDLFLVLIIIIIGCLVAASMLGKPEKG